MKLRVNILTVIVSAALSTQVSQAQTVDNTATLPNAKPGECYAKVITPTQYKTETEEVVIKQASETVEIVPAKYRLVEERVMVKEASSQVVPVPAEYEVVEEKVETVPARNEWFTIAGSGKNRDQIPVSPVLLEAVSNSGVDLTKALPGMCYKEHFIPAKYREETEKVLVNEESEEIESIEAQYEEVEERVLVKEASTVVEEIPAVFETVEEKVMIEPAKSVWKKGTGLVQKIDNTTGEIMCLVEIPAKYEVVATKVLKTPATTKVVEVPAEYKTVVVRKMVQPAQEKRINIPAEFTEVTKQVKVEDARFGWFAGDETVPPEATPTGQEICYIEQPAEFEIVEKRVIKTPATFQTVEIPPEFETVRVEKLVSPAEEKRIPVPAVTETVTKQVKVADSTMEWRRVLCETNMTKDIVANIQKALNREGFDVGPADGVIGGATLRAIEAYQMKNNLDRGGITYETLDALQVSTGTST